MKSFSQISGLTFACFKF